jgi:hypothetical protein
MAAQITGAPGLQAPAPSQASPCVHAFPSSHAAPIDLFGYEHSPVIGSHVAASWHASGAGHALLAPEQAPARQASFWVQASPSLQTAPSALMGLSQTPVIGLHAPAMWHWSSAAHVTAGPAWHEPLWQASFWVQASPSLQGAPSILMGFAQRPVIGSQAPATWHWSSAAQVTAGPAWQEPLWQESPWVQAFPSSHGDP